MLKKMKNSDKGKDLSKIFSVVGQPRLINFFFLVEETDKNG
jgi:hypothetical protein